MAPRKKSVSVAGEELAVDTRGRISVPLGGKDYVLRPSHEAIMTIERLTRPLMRLAEDALSFALPIDEMALIVAELMKAQGATMGARDPMVTSYQGAQPEKLAKMIYEAGSPRISARLGVLLSGAVNGGYTAEGEAKAGTSTTEAIPADE